ncbi:MAG: hypothetical protein MUC50_02625, partial [Myxococcota bacterium]|nr:hypothetical protein [Myxococcota bacterium]
MRGRFNDQRLYAPDGPGGVLRLSALLFWAWPLLVISCLPISSGAQVPAPVPLSPTAAQREAQILLDSDKPREAIALLKASLELHRDEMALHFLLARAYLRDGNDFWALRTLTTLLQLHPEDCEPLLWMAWIELKQGAVERARESLFAAHCLSGTPAATRKALLLASLEQQGNQPELARTHLTDARKMERIYKEDRAALDQLTAHLDPGYVCPFSGKLDLALGWASNATAGSPTDPASEDADTASPTGQLNLWLRLVGPTGRTLRPSVEVDARGLGYTADAGRDLGYLSLGARPGILFGNASPTALIAYHFDALLLAGGDRYEPGPLWFQSAHRGEVEVAPTSNLSVFGGAGRRLFRELGRSRIEVDGGLGGSLLVLQRLRLLGALAGRWHGADKVAYDLAGGSALAAAEVRLPRDWTLRAGALYGLDWYFRSAGFFDPLAPATKRRDSLLRLSASGFAPALLGVKAGLTYEYSARFSTALPYEYRDHRILLKLSVSFAADPFAPKTVSPEG